MNPHLELVQDFHAAFQYAQPTPTKPCVSDKATSKLRLALLREELSELANALCNESEVDTLDALCDIQYVLSGAVLALGYARVFDAAFLEVHRSNMTKLFDSPAQYRETLQMDATIDGKWIGRRADGKIMKPDTYSPADLAQFLA